MSIIWPSHLDEFLVVFLVAVFGEDTSDGLSLVQSLGGLPQAPGKTVVDQGLLEHLLDGLLDVHGSSGGGCGSGGHGGIISFDVRHGEVSRSSMSDLSNKNVSFLSCKRNNPHLGHEYSMDLLHNRSWGSVRVVGIALLLTNLEIVYDEIDYK